MINDHQEEHHISFIGKWDVSCSHGESVISFHPSDHLNESFKKLNFVPISSYLKLLLLLKNEEDLYRFFL
jgi:hypothetical protein